MDDNDHSSLFLGWLEQHGSSVTKVARAYTRTSDECEDLAQEILLQAWKALPTFRGEAQAATWFYRVALNTAMTWHRNDRRRRARYQSVVVEEVAADKPKTGDDLLRRETVERLYAAIHQLPKTDAAIVLLYLDELSYREMADVLGISENHVGVKLSRARRALAEVMNGDRDASR